MQARLRNIAALALFRLTNMRLGLAVAATRVGVLANGPLKTYRAQGRPIRPNATAKRRSEFEILPLEYAAIQDDR